MKNWPIDHNGREFTRKSQILLNFHQGVKVKIAVGGGGVGFMFLGGSLSQFVNPLLYFWD